MPRDVDDAQLLQLVRQGLSQREIARRTGIARATLYRRFQRLNITPVQMPVQSHDTGAVWSVDTGAVQQLEGEVQGLRLLMQSVVDRLKHPPVQTPEQITTLPPLSQRQSHALESLDLGCHSG
jgi:hypothetical protein